MNFVSIDFLIFLILVLIAFYALPNKYRTPLLLAASYFFYGYWSIPYLCLLIFTMVIDFIIAIKIEDAKNSILAKRYLILSLILNLGILFTFKYFNFFVDQLNWIVQADLKGVNLILPFAISFYTFHAMSYVIDVYRGRIKAERMFTPYSAYVMFFPQLVAGPIARAEHLLSQFKLEKKLTLTNISAGLWYIILGYLMKCVLADNIAPVVDYFFGAESVRAPFSIAQGTYLFAFQIYFDFAGYTYIAIGIAKLFDFELVQNFNYPYVSTSLSEFWHRWHISLSKWLRDYLYIGLGGNRSGHARTTINLLITMLLGGLWHGANLTFALWGGLHGLYLVVEKTTEKYARKYRFKIRIPKLVKIFITFNLVCFAWIPFRSENIHLALSNMDLFLQWLIHPIESAQQHIALQKKYFIMIGLWLLFEACCSHFNLYQKWMRANIAIKGVLIYLAIVVGFLFSQANPKAFIYFQF